MTKTYDIVADLTPSVGGAPTTNITIYFAISPNTKRAVIHTPLPSQIIAQHQLTTPQTQPVPARQKRPNLRGRHNRKDLAL